MSILEAIEESTRIAGIKGLAFADLQQFNSFHDSADALDYPINLVVPYTLQVPLRQPMTSKTLQLEGWVLTRIDEDTNDWRHPRIQKDYIDPMTRLAEKFLMAMSVADIADTGGNPPVATIMGEYMFLHSHLFGVSYRCNLLVKAKAC